MIVHMTVSTVQVMERVQTAITPLIIDNLMLKKEDVNQYKGTMKLERQLHNYVHQNVKPVLKVIQSVHLVK